MAEWSDIEKNDMILAVSLVAVAIICAIYIQVVVKKDGNVAVVSLDGQVYKELSLNVITELKMDGASGVDDYNIIVIENGYVYMKEADCADNICLVKDKIYEKKVGCSSLELYPTFFSMNIISSNI